MKYRYTQFDPRSLAASHQEGLKNLFLRLLMHAGGDVQRALDYLREIAERYGLKGEDGEDLDMDHLIEYLQDQGLIEAETRPRPGRKKGRREFQVRYQATRKAERSIRLDAFQELFQNLKADALKGDHPTPYSGLLGGGERLPETRPFEFGDRVQDIDFVESFSNAIRRHGPGGGFEMYEDDMRVHEVEQASSCATVLALDISHSMILYGEDRITPAKKVALALTELIQTQYPKDALEVIVFGDEARRIDPRQLAYVQVGPYHTNTQAALRLAQQLLERKNHANKQVLMITDGKASAIHEDGELYINSFGLDPLITSRTVDEAQLCRRRGILITTFMITSDPYLREFVEKLSAANKGRAFYADLDNLGRFVLMDYVKNRRRTI